MTNITKTMLDEAIKIMAEKLQKDFRNELALKEKEIQKIKVDLEAKISLLEEENSKLKKNVSDLGMKNVKECPKMVLKASDQMQKLHRHIVVL
jgi:hypothetical protein